MFGFPESDSRRGGLTRRRMLRNGVAGVASVYGAQRAQLEERLELGRGRGRRADEEVARHHLPQRRHRHAQLRRARRTSAKYHAHRPHDRRAAVPTATSVVGTTSVRRRPSGSGGELAFANPLVSGTGQERRHQGPRHAGRRPATSADLAYVPGCTSTRRTSRTSRRATTGSPGMLQMSRPAGSGAGSTSTARRTTPCRRSRSTPTCRSRSAPQGARLRARQPRRRALRGAGRRLESPTSNQRGAAARGDPGRDHPACSEPRTIWGLTCDVSNQLGRDQQPGANPDYPPARSRIGCSSRPRCSAPASAPSSSPSTGARSTRTVARSRRIDPQLTTLSRALAAFQHDLVARGIEQHVTTRRLHRVRAARRRERLAGDRSRRRRPMLLMGSAVRGGLAG